MQTIAVMSQKGGAGKTTVTLNLGVAAEATGLSVGIIDLDPQQSSATWGDARDGSPGVISGQATRLPKLLQAARDGGADLVLIDSSPGRDNSHMAIAREVDLILVPCRPSALDIQAILPTFDVVKMSGKAGYAVMNAAPVSSPYLVEQGREALATWSIETSPIVLHHRLIYSTAYASHQGVTEAEPNGKAASEVKGLFQWLSKTLHLPTAKPKNRLKGRMSSRI